MDTLLLALAPILATVATAATPLLLAALGELVTERAGVLNLGVEGMMLVGAVSGFIAGTSGAGWVGGAAVAALAGAAFSLIFAVLVLFARANQVASGLALTIFGVGLSALIGQGHVGEPFRGSPGAVLLGLDPFVLAALAAAVAIGLTLTRTRIGMVLRAVGENHDAAHAMGYPVVAIRIAAIAFGGAMAGLGGAYLSLVYTPMWSEGMTAGRGWIALALVVFAAWRPLRCVLGAYLFGGVAILELGLQGSGLLQVPPQILAMLPYLATIAVLVWISARSGRGSLAAPGSLGRPFHPPG